MRNIKNVFVNGISLVSKYEAPAVEQAENRFALFKTVKTIKKENNKEILNKKIDEILKNLQKK